MVALPRHWLLAGIATLALPWLVVGAVYLRSGGAADVGEPPPAATGPTRTAAGGPWGHLSVTPIIVSPPLEYVAADWGRSDEPYRWFFPGTTPDVLRAFLNSTGLSPDEVSRLEAGARPDDRIRGLTIQPDLELLRGLSPDVRARLYLQLARSPLNGDQANSFRFFGGSAG